MTTYVLVHGAWSGAHSFRKVRPLLQAHGHQVFTPSLTGLGERAHLTSPLVGLSTHIHDVVNQVLYEDLLDITLLGYSYGGMVVTGSLEHIAERVRHLVYLDAFVPADGQSIATIVGNRSTVSPAIGFGTEWLVPSAPRTFDDPAEADWIIPRRAPQPGLTLTEPVRLARPLEDLPFTRTYIKATADGTDQPGGSAFWAAADMAKASNRWDYREIDTNHMVASNKPEELADILLGLT